MPNNIRKDFDYVDEWKSLWEPDMEAIAYNGATCDPTKVDPKVLHWVKENCAHMPHFIKVIKHSAAFGWRDCRGGKLQCRLGVPRPFVRDHFQELERVVTLQAGGSHRKWKVSFTSAARNAFWLQGWRRVARDNSLQPGDVMIFILVGNSHFRFQLFDEDGNVHKSTPTSNDAAAPVKEESIRADSPSHLEGSVGNKKRPLVSVKAEPGLSQPSASHDETNSSGSDDLVVQSELPIATGEQIAEPQRKKLTVERVGTEVEESRLGLLTKENPASSDKETMSRGEHMLDTNLTPNTERHSSKPSSENEISLNDSILAEKPGANCTKIPGQSVEVAEEQATRKLEVEVPKKPMKAELCSAKNGVISRQPPALPTAPQEQRTNPPHDPIDPLAFIVKSKRRKIINLERKRAQDMATTYAEAQNGNRFVIVLSEAQVYQDFHLQLPDQFVVDSRLPPCLTRLSLVDVTGKAWEMYSKRNSGGQVAFHRKYWGIFVLEHFLEEGDVCVFQLQNTNILTILVRIFRVVGLPKIATRSIHENYELRLKTKS